VFLGLQRAGSSVVIQGDRQAAMSPGNLVLYDSAKSYVPANRTGVSHHYFRIPKREPALHLGDRDLTPARIAAAHHISVRRLYSVLSSAGIGLGDWIRARRLEQCRAELAGGAPHLTVAGVARRWGFVNAAHFSRVFREAYGVAPRDLLR
jgi:AraC-like DNA-binding protein